MWLLKNRALLINSVNFNSSASNGLPCVPDVLLSAHVMPGSFGSVEFLFNVFIPKKLALADNFSISN